MSTVTFETFATGTLGMAVDLFLYNYSLRSEKLKVHFMSG